MPFKRDETLVADYVGVYTEDNEIRDGYHLFHDYKDVYHVESKLAKKVIYVYRADSWQYAMRKARWKLSKDYPNKQQDNNYYKILFYEKGNKLYYITTNKKVVKMRETFTPAGFPTYVAEKLNSNDYELLKQFNLDQVYEEKILNFRRSRGIVPERAKEIIWEVF